MPRSSGTKPMPAWAVRCSGSAHQVLAVEGDRAGALADNAHDGAQRRGLADAVAAEQGHGLALIDVEIDAVQRMAFAIPGVEIADASKGSGVSSCSVPI